MKETALLDDMPSDPILEKLKSGERPQVFFDVSANSRPLGRIVMELYNDVTPYTTENFRCLCTGERGIGAKGKALHYRGSIFHRIIPNFMAQGGDITHGNGHGGESIYGEQFPDENFAKKHDRAGLLSMANAGKNTNGSQFFITTVPTPHLDGKHVVFGAVTSGMNVLKQIEERGSRTGMPLETVVIDDCGQLPPSASTTTVDETQTTE